MVVKSFSVRMAPLKHTQTDSDITVGRVQMHHKLKHKEEAHSGLISVPAPKRHISKELVRPTTARPTQSHLPLRNFEKQATSADSSVSRLFRNKDVRNDLIVSICGKQLPLVHVSGACG